MTTRETRTPAIPQVTQENLLDVVRALKEVVEVREGRRGDEMDEAVTFRDLVAAGLLKRKRDGSYGDNTTTTDLPVTGTNEDGNVPPAPTNLQASGVYSQVTLTWNVPPYRNHGYTEVWRCETDTLANAGKVGATAGTLFTDPTGTTGTFWYWARNVSNAGVAGPFNSEAGTAARTVADVSSTIALLNEALAKSPLMQDLRSRITGLEDGTFVPEYINDVVIRSDSIARESKTLVSRTEGNYAAVQQTMSAIGGLRASYTVKVDVGGHLAGFGLAAYKNTYNSAVTSDFIVAADRFAVAPAAIVQSTAPTVDLFPGKVWVDTSGTEDVTKYYTGSGWSTDPVYARHPIIVLTAPTTIDGKLIQPGVYIDTAFIATLQADKITAGTISAAISLTSPKLLGGQFTAYSWPTTAGGGYYLGPEGFLMGTTNVTVAATTMVAGKRYRIKSVGTTDFTLVGAASNTVGVSFTATGAATGTGTVALESFWQFDYASGAVYGPGFSLVNGVMTLDQLNIIGTGQVVAGAIATPQGAELPSDTSLGSSGGTVTVMSVTVNTDNRPLWVHTQYSLTGASGTITVDIYVNGVQERTVTFGSGTAPPNLGDSNDGSGWSTTPNANVRDSVYVPTPGSGSISVELRAVASTTGSKMLSRSNLFVIGTKR